MELDEVPEHLLIMGGDYIGLEFGQMFCCFGGQVTIIQTHGIRNEFYLRSRTGVRVSFILLFMAMGT